MTLTLGASGLGLALIVLLLAYQALHLAAYPLWVPFTYHEGDSVVMLMYIKGLVQDGWPLTMTHLSAPFSYPGAAFPMQTSTDWLVIKATSLFTQNPGLLINMFWLWTAVMSAWATAYAAYQMCLSALLAVMIAAGPQVMRAPNQARVVALAACVLQGFDYVYYSFFAVLLFSMAALVGARDWRALRLPLLAMVLVGSATVINLAPSLYSWNRDGRAA